jgi:glutamyl/glutaminyl-tRNA synthetase
MGDLESNPQAIDDFVLIKSDGYPTYNFCHIVDDCLMGITHVLRSQEYISSIPRYLNLYEALKVERPILVTLPFVMAIDGKKKLSKRDGAKGILDYAIEGYLPEAIINFLATLGWNDGTEQEVFSVEEIIAKFDISRIQKSPARFDEKRLLWLNGQHIRLLSIDDLYSRSNNFWPTSALTCQRDYRMKVLSLVQDRLKTLADLPILTNYFFEEPTPDKNMIASDKYLSKKEGNYLNNILQRAFDNLSKIDVFTAENIKNALNNLIIKTEENPGIVFSLIRYSISWAPFSPALDETLEVLGKDKSLARISRTLEEVF